MKQLTDPQVSRLKKIIEKFPEIKKVALQFNQEGIDWGLAAGSPYFIYFGQEEFLDDADVWVAEKDKNRYLKSSARTGRFVPPRGIRLKILRLGRWIFLQTAES